MLDQLRRLGNAVASTVTRAKVSTATIGPRTMLQVTGLDNEVFDDVELLLPFGMVALPVAGSDVMLFQVNGSRDHKVALMGDNTGDVVATLGPGEIGFSRNGQTVLLRANGVEVVTPLAINLAAPTTTAGGNLVAGVGASGTFSTPTGQMVTVRDGIITNIF